MSAERMSPCGRSRRTLQGHRRRRTIPDDFHRNGVCCAVTRDHLVGEGRILDVGARAVVIERHWVNIDEAWKLDLAQWLLARQEG